MTERSVSPRFIASKASSVSSRVMVRLTILSRFNCPWRYHSASMGKSRVEAFSDGVFAILITIMVLELRPPEGQTLDALRPLWGVFLSYAMSFVFLGVYWNGHHHLLYTATRQAIDHIEYWSERFTTDHGVKPLQLRVLCPIEAEVALTRNAGPELQALLSNPAYSNKGVVDKHFLVGGTDDPSLGFAGSVRTSNTKILLVSRPPAQRNCRSSVKSE